ncbi:DUF1501 domain-containing protein [Alteromonas lipolytica]|nr:DUF1501 domain-containing protein [Alteromonas lipolytica]GGF61293.1 Tat pathway signal protein [Alteromonas lipolytica]
MQRREFIKRSLAGLTGAGSLLATSSQFNLVNAATNTNSFTDYKALVCVFLLGGNDSLNMLIPTDNPGYQAYAATRQNLAVPLEQIINLQSAAYGSAFGLHPSLAPMADLFNSGAASFVANVGTLIEPVDKTRILNGRALLPPQLFSHSDQQNHWQSGIPQDPALTGWAGRMADLLGDSQAALSMNLSLAGSNLWQTGNQVLPFALGPQGADAIVGLNPEHDWLNQNAGFLDRIHTGADTLFAREYRQIVDRTRRTGELVNTSLMLAPELQTLFPATSLAQQLQTVAKMIAVQQHLNQPRQVFFVAMGGWDTHDNQLIDQPLLLAELAGGLQAFYQATEELGLAQQVTTFTASDFGRTLTSNGDGTDHGWGGHQIVVGGAVNGGDIVGTMPALTLDSNDDMGDGRIIPTLAVDQYAATLARWYGLSESQLHEILPNLQNFASADLGFMA